MKDKIETFSLTNLPFDEGLEILTEKGLSLVSLQEMARLRMQGKGYYSDYPGTESWTREGVIYVPKKGAYLTKNSPIMANAKEATRCHRNRSRFYLTNEQVERSLEGAIKLVEKAIPTDRFATEELTAYAFGEDAQRYGEFLKQNNINEMPIWLVRVQDKPFARQIAFSGANPFHLSALNSRVYLSDWEIGWFFSRYMVGVKNSSA